jgi:hypothetical protein
MCYVVSLCFIIVTNVAEGTVPIRMRLCTWVGIVVREILASGIDVLKHAF